MATTAREVFRDFVADGIPSSGNHTPYKPEIRRLLTGYETIINAFTSNGGLIYVSKAAMDADLAKAANSMAWVVGDAIAANNGIYGKVGASGSGSWTRRADLPFSFIIASDAGAGTANAIQATTSIPVSSSALVWMNVFAANTASPVTVSFNGGAPLTVKSNTGEDVEIGGLVPGMILLGIASGSSFRLFSDETIAAKLYAARDDARVAQSASEAARDIAAGYASDAVSQGNVPIYATIAGMSGLTVQAGIKEIRVNGRDAARDGLGGLFTDTNNGSSETFKTNGGARTWYRVADVGSARFNDAALALINGPKRMLSEKRVITSDWQCVPEQAVQIAAQRALMAEINQYHGDASAIDFPGDLVDRPTENNTGAAPGYGFPELLADLRTYLPKVPTNRIFFMPGNHERDGTGMTLWAGSSSFLSYRKMIGPEFYYTRKGNFCRIYMGDMAGSVGGEILDHVIDWFKAVVTEHALYNIIVFMHQPPDPTVFPGFAPDSSYYQYQPKRITDVIAAANNIVAVYYGHVHSSTLASVTTVTNAYGTTWINEAAGIPTCYTSGAPAFDIPYCLEFTNEGSTNFLVRRWNSIKHELMAGYDIARTLKYPAVLGGDTYDYDGRVQQQRDYMTSYGPATIWWSMAETRNNSAPYSPPTEKTIMQNLVLLDDSNDSAPIGSGTATAYWVPGQATISTSDGFNITGIPGGAIGAIAGARRTTQANQEDWQSAYEIHVRDSTGALPLLAAFIPATASAGGLDIKGAAYQINGNIVVDRDRKLRLRSYTAAELSNLTANPSTPIGQLVMCSDGNAGQPCLAVSRGGSGGWARIVLGTNVSAT